MAKEKKRDAEQEAVIDLGFGGLFKGLGTFVDLLAKMAEAGQTERAREGAFRLKDLGGRARGVYGFSVRVGVGGMPHVEAFGNVRAGDEGPVVTEVREPLVDVFDEGPAIVVVAELPGVADDEIRVALRDDLLSLETTGERKYARDVSLPARVAATPSHRQYTNGILELRLTKVT